MKTRRNRSLRERAAPRKTDVFRQLEGKSALSEVFCLATAELREALARARATVTEAEQAMAQGSMPFEEAMESCKAASAGVCEAATNSATAGQTETRRKMQAIMQNLQQISNGLAEAKQGVIGG